MADDVSPNTRVECPKVPTELRLREPLIDSGGEFERFLLPRLRFIKRFGYLNFELLKCLVIYVIRYLNF